MVRMGIAPCSPFSVTNDCMVGGALLGAGPSRDVPAAPFVCARLPAAAAHVSCSSLRWPVGLLSGPNFPLHLASYPAAELARQYQHVRLHTHLAENAQDIAFSEKTYGCRPGGYLK